MMINVSSESGPPKCRMGGEDNYSGYLVSAQSCVALVSIVGNSLILYLLASHKFLRRSANNLFVASLAMADLLVGLNIPYYISFYYDVPYKCNITACVIRYVLTLYVTIVSVLLLVGVAVDRYLSVIYSLKYHNSARYRLAKRVISFLYIYVLILVASPAYYNIQWTEDLEECDLVHILSFGYCLYVVLLHVVLTLVLNLILYYRIFKEAWRLLNKAATPTYKSGGIYKETRTAVTMALILGVTMASLLPYAIILILRQLNHGQSDYLSDTKKFIVVLYFGKSAVNPLIYGWKNVEFRQAFFRSMMKKSQQQQHPQAMAEINRPQLRLSLAYVGVGVAREMAAHAAAGHHRMRRHSDLGTTTTTGRQQPVLCWCITNPTLGLCGNNSTTNNGHYSFHNEII